MEIRALAEVQNDLISVGLDGKIYKIDPAIGSIKLLSEIKFTSPINCLFFSASGNYLATGHDNFSVFVWDLKNLKGNSDSKIINYKEFKGHKGTVRTIVFSPDDSHLAASGKDSTIILWDLQGQQPAQEKTVKATAAVKSLVYINDGGKLISAQENGELVLWDIKREEGKVLFKNKKFKPLAMALNKSKNNLLVGFSDGTLTSFDLNFTDINQIKHWDFKAHSAGVEYVTFNKDFSLVATAASDKSIKFFNFHTYFENYNSIGSSTELKTYNSKVKSIIFTSDNKIITGCEDKSVRVLEISSEKLVAKICSLLKTNMLESDWKSIVGEDIPYEKTCTNF
jgi:WD40 repeat protein